MDGNMEADVLPSHRHEVDIFEQCYLVWDQPLYVSVLDSIYFIQYISVSYRIIVRLLIIFVSLSQIV